MIAQTGIPRRSLVIFILLAVIFLAQMTWWIIFHMRTSETAIEQLRDNFKIKRESVVNILNNQYQLLYDQAAELYRRQNLQDIVHNPLVTGYGLSLDEIPPDSLSLVVQVDSTKILLFLDRDYPSKLIGQNDAVQFMTVKSGMFMNPRWVRAENVELDHSGVDVLERETKKHTRMLIMEGSFFVLLILIGLWMIYISIKKRKQAAEEQTLFVHSITHELKIPITSVNLFLDTIKRREYEPDLTRELLPKMKEDLRRLNGLVDNILNIRKLSEKRPKVLPEADLSSEVQGFAKRIREKVETAGGKTSVDIEPGLHIRALTGELQRVWDTLVDNSIKYARSPELKIEINLKRNGSKAVLEVTDNGPGINEELLERVFEKFSRGEDSNTRGIPGSGLGLFIAREYVVRNGGEIEIGNVAPRGCRVTMRFNTVS